MRKTIFVSIICIIVTGCSIPFFNPNYYKDRVTISASDEIRLKAYYAGEYYLDSNMDYELGGDDTVYVPPYRSNSRGIDCSGLVVNCYKFAVEETEYYMPFSDASADNIYKEYSENVSVPQKGDLIIWSDEKDFAYHIALLDKIEAGYYYFIESNLIDYLSVNGVNYRKLSVNTTYNITIKRLSLIKYE